MKRYTLVYIVIGMILCSLASCESVKPYQRVYLNDYEMKPGQPGSRKFEENVHAYREGASGGGSSKTSGGCGCN
ncbi:MAG: DUF4266 domain-containing protein [Cyclobacteriaceae bacterium]|nr:DUF4266 domain-containing protein [Cyclobacteriaceae bacterium]MDH4298151.1 DUF4266 domain-containing protein [Cyclobacteriaceae bacterium]MDH5251523.1 DUF4266 domain-containing protein [Cyclobacteriaceae bacterium]